jgi:hypothetical protein
MIICIDNLLNSGRQAILHLASSIGQCLPPLRPALAEHVVKQKRSTANAAKASLGSLIECSTGHRNIATLGGLAPESLACQYPINLIELALIGHL